MQQEAEGEWVWGDTLNTRRGWKLRSGLIQELEESLAWNKLEPWRVSPPGEVGRQGSSRGEIGVGDKHLRNGVWDSV